MSLNHSPFSPTFSAFCLHSRVDLVLSIFSSLPFIIRNLMTTKGVIYNGISLLFHSVPPWWLSIWLPIFRWQICLHWFEFDCEPSLEILVFVLWWRAQPLPSWGLERKCILVSLKTMADQIIIFRKWAMFAHHFVLSVKQVSAAWVRDYGET